MASPSPQQHASDQVARTPGQVRLEGNRLQHQRSLYLQQHSNNPVDWYAWDNEALARAEREDKPIFLSVGYAACHWCHVMEHEVFGDDTVAAFMNDQFVNIKVDREERPDLDAVYMQAVQMMTGGGGWPMSVFLTPDRMPFFGGTFFPREQFLALSARVADAFRARRSEVETHAASIAAAIGAGIEGHSEADVQPQIIEEAVEQAKRAYDRDRGGFQGRMKFPTPLRWRFLLRRYRKTGEVELAQMVRGTLDQMACGGIRDHVGGGFHRYTVDAAWIVPHFEKMLYDNAQLASLYLEAAAVFDSATYRDVARETLSFLLREMVDVRGGVYASFDADSGGEEGSYYVWTPSELRALAGERDGKILAALLGVTDAGNFDGKSVLTRHVSVRSVAEKFDLEPSEVERLLDAWKPAMIEARAKRVRPGLDRKVVTAWTALAISAFAEGYRLLGDARYLAAAQQASEFLWTAHRKPDGSLYRVSNGGEPSDEGILDDYGNFACALLDLYEATGEVEHVRRAQQLVDLVLEVFTRDDGGFYMTRRGQDAPLGRRFDVFDDVEPSGNSSALHAAHRLSVITGMPKYRTCVDTSLRAIGGFAARAGMELAWWLDVAQLLHGPAYVVVIAGDTGDALTAALERAIHGRLPPQATLVRVPSGGPSAEQRSVIEVARDATATGGRPTAYVCAPGACQLPTTEAAELVRQIMQGWTA